MGLQVPSDSLEVNFVCQLLLPDVDADQLFMKPLVNIGHKLRKIRYKLSIVNREI